ncbi:MAG: hypothetical protein WCQ60_03845, partial [bacterium]
CENFSIKGFDVNVSKKDMLMYLKNDKPDIIIGATGTSIFDASDLSSLGGEHVYHFLSISSSDREFPVASFRDGNNKKVHNDVVYKNFVFVNNGFPITFLGLKYESTPAEMEKTIALLMGSVLHGATRGFGGGEGLIDVPKELEDLINE